MKSTGIVRRFDDIGRIVVPKEFRRKIFGKENSEGMPMEIFIDGENIIMRRYVENVCKWEYKHPFGDFPGCKSDVSSISFSKDLKYCPYCGKRIEVR